MRDVLPQLIDRVRKGPVVLARVVAVTGAGPREIGAAMVVTGSGEVIGSLSGGCVEAAVVESARGVLADGEAVLERFGIADPDGFAVGLTCGGEMEICLERVDAARLPELRALDREIRAGRAVALATTLTANPSWLLVHPAERAVAQSEAGARGMVDGGAAPDGEVRAVSGGGALVSRDALNMARAGRTGIIGSDECADSAFPPRSFVQSFGPPARMILAGANDFVRALSRLGAQLGYRVTVVDARETFTTATRFPAAHEVVVDWPHRYLRGEYASGRIDDRTVVCVLTHDSKFDVPMLAEALSIERIAFIGALGSRRTHADRVERLLAAGVAPEQLRRLRSPLGLDLNASTPDETAVSIAAQLIAESGRASGRPLDETDGPIHY
ncbi:XdhC family protein [Nocardia sp. NPDC052001]|uniref:XdhC family protein n=1 Tax=Nocardia sp. NPDC052001 TaxID=3154853 RepID=UPI00341443F2